MFGEKNKEPCSKKYFLKSLSIPCFSTSTQREECLFSFKPLKPVSTR